MQFLKKTDLQEMSADYVNVKFISKSDTFPTNAALKDAVEVSIMPIISFKTLSD